MTTTKQIQRIDREEVRQQVAQIIEDHSVKVPQIPQVKRELRRSGEYRVQSHQWNSNLRAVAIQRALTAAKYRDSPSIIGQPIDDPEKVDYDWGRPCTGNPVVGGIPNPQYGGNGDGHDEWICYQSHIAGIGTDDGSFKTWVNGVQVMNFEGLEFENLVRPSSLQYLTLQQRLRNLVECFQVLSQKCPGTLERFRYDPPHFLVDLDRRVFGVLNTADEVTTEEDLVIVAAERDRSKAVTHSPLTDHLACQRAGLLDVVARPCRYLSQDQFFRCPSAEHDRQVVVGLGILRADLKGRCIMHCGIFEIALLGQGISHVSMRLRIVGFNAQRLCIVANGSF